MGGDWMCGPGGYCPYCCDEGALPPDEEMPEDEDEADDALVHILQDEEAGVFSVELIDTIGNNLDTFLDAEIARRLEDA